MKQRHAKPGGLCRLCSRLYYDGRKSWRGVIYGYQCCFGRNVQHAQFWKTCDLFLKCTDFTRKGGNK